MAKTDKKVVVAEKAPSVNAKVQKTIKTLSENPEHYGHVKAAYINEAGEFHLVPRPGFSKYKITSTEVDEIDTVEDEIDEPAPAETKPTDNLEF